MLQVDGKRGRRRPREATDEIGKAGIKTLNFIVEMDDKEPG